MRALADRLLCAASSLAELAGDARVGTSSLRRRAQVLAARPDLRVVDLHGNVDSRLRRLHDGDFDAVVLAAAGLQRLGLPCDGWLACDEMVPAPGQGALMLEARAEDARTIELAAGINDAASARALQAERTMASAFGATYTPFGAYARNSGERLTLDCFVGASDGSVHARVREEGWGADARLLAETVLGALRREHRDALDAALGPSWVEATTEAAA